VKAPQFAAASLLAFASLFLPAVTSAQTDPVSEQVDYDYEPQLQLIRVSYLQGDVRFNRGSNYEPDLKKPWEIAAMNMPIEQGFTLATGEGRAEIEFEHGAVLYLAENSVLLFGVAIERNNQLETQLELLCGSATVAVHTEPSEVFEIATPVRSFSINSPEQSYVRIDSYLNGASMTPKEDPGFDFRRSGAESVHAAKGDTVTYQNGSWPRLDNFNPAEPLSDFDAWVETRFTARSLEMKAALHASGLAVPILGLIDMYEDGKFSPCPPYGMCWEPNSILPPDSPVPAAASEASEARSTPAPSLVLASYVGGHSASGPNAPQVREAVFDDAWGQNSTAGAATAAPQRPAAAPSTTVPFNSLISGCPFPNWTTTNIRANSPAERDALIRRSAAWQLSQGWTPTVCHYGRWIGNHHYRAVVRRHRCPPVHWVKVGHKTGFVPVHPGDLRGRTPANLKNGYFAISSEKSRAGIEHSEHVTFNPATEKAEKIETPKGFRNSSLPVFAKSTPPQIQARVLATPTHAANSKDAIASSSSSKAVYNYSSGKFTSGGTALGHTSHPLAVASFNSHGDLTRGSDGHSVHSSGASFHSSGASGGAGGFHGGGSGGSGHSGGSGGSGGGGGHGGGGSSGGGGGHSGGGGSSGGGGGGGHGR
jgi:hypothetical protein